MRAKHSPIRKRNRLAVAVAMASMVMPYPVYSQSLTAAPEALTPLVNDVSSALLPVTTAAGSALSPITNPLDSALSPLNEALAGDPIGAALAPLTEPLGAATAPVIETVDVALDPLTDPIDQLLLAPVVEVAEPLTAPAVDALSPALTPIDSVTEDLTSGSVSDALSPSDGEGLLGDALGSGDSPASGGDTDSSASSNPLAPITEPLGEVLQPVVAEIDAALDPVTNPVDEQVLAPVVEALTPVTEPLTEALEPVLTPVDAIVNDLTGGSVTDALSPSDGEGVLGNALGSDANLEANSDNNVETGNSGDANSANPLAPITEPLGEVLQPIVEAVDTTLDPVTDPVDELLLNPIVDVLSPVTDSASDALNPVLGPIDSSINNLTEGSAVDALTSNDSNTADGNGVFNDTLGGEVSSSNNELRPNGNNNPALLALFDAERLNTEQCVDSDADGVCDSRDRCADTPAGEAVLPNGCHLDGVSALRLEGVFFEFDKAVLTAESVATLDAAIAVIKASGAPRLEVAGHTDSLGDDDYNMTLSQRRAIAVQNYFIEHGIDEERLQARGYGKSQPSSDNDSDAGRAKNRRVELKVLN